MLIYLPIAELAVNAEVILMVGGVVGFLSGVFGVGGGFFATPFMIFLGIPSYIAVATQANNLVASSSSGVLGHLRRGNVDVKIGSIMLGGGIAGSFIGIMIFKLLQYMGQIDFAVSFLYIVLLGIIGTMMLLENVISRFKKKTVRAAFNQTKVSKFMASLPYQMRFPRSKLYISALVPMGIGFVGGILAAILGIGGGFLLVPAMIYILRMSPILAAGTSLFQIVFTTAVATIMHATLNHGVDIVLAILLMIGAIIGSQIGLAISRKIKPNHARFILACLLLLVCFRLSWDLFTEPLELFSTVTK